MEPGKDVVFLRSRRGFVKVALQHGASLIVMNHNRYNYDNP